MKTSYLIIGAGLAGCTAGYLLARTGADVIIVEKQQLAAKSKLCGGLLTPRALDEAERIFGAGVNNVYRQSFDHIICVAASHRVPVHGVRMKSTYRKELDDFALAACVEAGCRVVDGLTPTGVDTAACSVTAKAHDGGIVSIEYDTLIAADGALSYVRQALTGEQPRGVFTLETRVPAVSDEVTMLFNPVLFGYCWYIPAGDEAVVGCCSFDDASSLDEALRWFAAEQGVTFETRRGAFMPSGANVMLRRGDVYFLGDAAGLICPPSGEGIYYALKSARCLVQALTNASSYQALMAKDVAEIGRQLKTRDLFFNERFINAGLGAAGATPYGKERAVKFALRHFVGFSGK